MHGQLRYMNGNGGLCQLGVVRVCYIKFMRPTESIEIMESATIIINAEMCENSLFYNVQYACTVCIKRGTFANIPVLAWDGSWDCLQELFVCK